MRIHPLTILFLIAGFFQLTVLKGINIEGQISNYPGKEITVNLLFDRFPMPDDNKAVTIDGAGRFFIDIQIERVRWAELSAEDRKVQLFLDPDAKRLIVKFDFKDLANSLSFEEESRLENAFINRWLLSNYHPLLESLNPEMRSDPEKSFVFLDGEQAKVLKGLEGIKNQVSPANYTMLEAETRNYFLTLKIQLGINVGNRDVKSYRNTWMDGNDRIGELIDCMPPDRDLLYYNHLIGTYAIHLERKMQACLLFDSVTYFSKFNVDSRADIEAIMVKDYYNLPLYVLGKDALCKGAFEKLLANRIYRACKEGDFENLYYVFSEFERLYPESSYLPNIKSEMAGVIEFEKRKNGDIEGIFFYPTTLPYTSLKDLLNREEFQEKVVLIDIWGTWCWSCREEFPFLNEVKAKLKGQNIAFLYLAHEKFKNPVDHWQETAKFFHLTGYHYLLNQDVLKDFWDTVNPNSGLMSYPTYVIIDKHGEVAVNNAPYPSDGDQLLEQIRTVLGRN